MMIKHSELTQQLMNMRQIIDNLVVVTNKGVTPEGHTVESLREKMAHEFHSASPIPKTPNRHNSGFVFGTKSKNELSGVHPKLVEFAYETLRLSEQDFMVFDGLRTEAEQRRYVAAGTSKTLNSKHLKQSDGYSHAVDLVPVVGTIPKWDWQLIYSVVLAADQAAMNLGIDKNIRWGGAWDRTLAQLNGERNEDWKRIVEDYCARHAGRDFIDGPHFEWRA